MGKEHHADEIERLYHNEINKHQQCANCRGKKRSSQRKMPDDNSFFLMNLKFIMLCVFIIIISFIAFVLFL